MLIAGGVFAHSRADASVVAVHPSTYAERLPIGSDTELDATVCPPAALFQAAIAKEHFNLSAVPSGPRLSVQKCDGGWAVALVSRPNVGMTDGFTLFKWQESHWIEVTQLPNGAVECNLEAEGISPTLALKLAGGFRGTSVAGCTTPKHGIATAKSDMAYESLLAHLPHRSLNVEISAVNADKEVVLVVKVNLSQADSSDNSAAVARYKRLAVAYMETYGVNPADYVVRYSIVAPRPLRALNIEELPVPSASASPAS